MKYDTALMFKAADFYKQAPTGQYDNEASHALEAYPFMLGALQNIAIAKVPDQNSIIAARIIEYVERLE